MINKKLLAFVFIAMPFLYSNAQNSLFKPGQTWNDTKGQFINVHAGQIVQTDGYYYWIGDSRTKNLCNGVGCYRSTDLLNWTNCGLLVKLSGEESDSNKLFSGLHLFRPKILYNEQTKQWVIWAVWENPDGSRCENCVFTSENIEGPYELQWIGHVLGQQTRDYTIFKSNDKNAWFVASSNGNQDIWHVKLSDDYQTYTDENITSLSKCKYEAPALFQLDDKYFGLFSGCTYWDPNRSRFAWGYDMLSTWDYDRVFSDNTGSGIEFCVDEGKVDTYKSQSAFVFKVDGDDKKLIYVGDRWNENNLGSSLQVWLPISMRSGIPTVRWYDEWDMSVFDDMYRMKRTADIQDGGQYLLLERNSNRFISRVSSAFELGDDDSLTNVSFTFHATDLPYSYKLQDNASGNYLESIYGSLRLNAENSKSSQLWTLLMQEDGTYKIKNNDSELCLTVSGSSTYVGSGIYLSKESSKLTQNFGVYFDSKKKPEYNEASIFTLAYRDSCLNVINEQNDYISNVDDISLRISNTAFEVTGNNGYGHFTIISPEYGKCLISIFDTFGNLIYKRELGIEGKTDLNLSNMLASGTYIMSLKSDNHEMRRKFIMK